MGTVTEIADYLRLLYARVGVPHCPSCGKRIEAQTVQQIVDRVLALPEGTRLLVLAPIARARKGELKLELERLRREGFVRARIDGSVVDLGDEIELDRVEDARPRRRRRPPRPQGRPQGPPDRQRRARAQARRGAPARRQLHQGQSAIDTALVRLFTARIKLGMFDPPESDPYSKIDEKELDSPEHRALALKLANESMVLLKNDGTLPLKPGIKKIAVIGPLAEQTRVLLGNYSGTPTHSVSVLDGLKAEFPNAEITYVAGTQFLGSRWQSGARQRADNPRWKARAEGRVQRIHGIPAKPSEIGLRWFRRIEPNINLDDEQLARGGSGEEIVERALDRILTAPDSGDYLIGVRGKGFARVTVNDKQVAMLFSREANQAKLGRVHLEKGKKAALKCYLRRQQRSASCAAHLGESQRRAVARGPCRGKECRCRDCSRGNHQRTRRRRDACD